MISFIISGIVSVEQWPCHHDCLKIADAPMTHCQMVSCLFAVSALAKT
jgi:hypothetical protein